MKARKLELKSIDFTDQQGTKSVFKYTEALQTVITTSGPQGISTDDVLKAIEVKHELDKSNGALCLSEADYNWLLGKINGTVRWVMATEPLAEFIKDVRSAPTVEMEAV